MIVQRNDRNMAALAATAQGVQCVGDVRATSNMAVALTDTASKPHSAIARFANHDHAIVVT